MIVEFAGCTGAGKTTIASAAVRRLRADGVVVNDCTGRTSSLAVTARNALATPMLMASLLRRHDSNLSYLRSVSRAIRDRRLPIFWTAVRSAAAVRLVGTHAQRAQPGRNGRTVSIVDEGILTTLSLLFDEDGMEEVSEIDVIAEAIPLPDVVVLVDAPLDALVDRVLRRDDSPRDMRRLSTPEVRARLSGARAAFNALAARPRVSSRVIRVWNPPTTVSYRESEIERAAAALSERLREWPA